MCLSLCAYMCAGPGPGSRFYYFLSFLFSRAIFAAAAASAVVGVVAGASTYNKHGCYCCCHKSQFFRCFRRSRRQRQRPRLLHVSVAVALPLAGCSCRCLQFAWVWPNLLVVARRASASASHVSQRLHARWRHVAVQQALAKQGLQ